MKNQCERHRRRYRKSNVVHINLRFNSVYLLYYYYYWHRTRNWRAQERKGKEKFLYGNCRVGYYVMRSEELNSFSHTYTQTCKNCCTFPTIEPYSNSGLTIIIYYLFGTTTFNGIQLNFL